MSNKKEKVEFVRGEAFDAVDEELSSAMSLLDETNTRIAELLNTESRGDLPFVNMPPEPAVASETPPTETPRLRRKGKAAAAAEVAES